MLVVATAPSRLCECQMLCPSLQGNQGRAQQFPGSFHLTLGIMPTQGRALGTATQQPQAAETAPLHSVVAALTPHHRYVACETKEYRRVCFHRQNDSSNKLCVTAEQYKQPLVHNTGKAAAQASACHNSLLLSCCSMLNKLRHYQGIACHAQYIG